MAVDVVGASSFLLVDGEHRNGECATAQAMDQPPMPFDQENWRRMVQLVEFLAMPHEVQDRLGQAIVRLRLSQAREVRASVSADGLPENRRSR